LGEYDFQPAVQHDAPLVFIGRIEEIKGTHLAIEIARRSSRRLVIAGNIPRGHRDYFERMVRPHIDGDCVKYVGPIDDREKNVLLGQAAALVMAVLWDEPFGIVMAEALACGTPVLGLRRGAVPEVVEDGVSGFVRDDIDGLVAVTSRLCDIDRAACRARAERLFSDTVMVDRYLEIYRRLIALC
jgi:glycosyltransferase involved in cell wall biosynthesis